MVSNTKLYLLQNILKLETDYLPSFFFTAYSYQHYLHEIMMEVSDTETCRSRYNWTEESAESKLCGVNFCVVII